MVLLRDVSFLAAGAFLAILVHQLYNWLSGNSQTTEENVQPDTSAGAGDDNTLETEFGERQNISGDGIADGADDANEASSEQTNESEMEAVHGETELDREHVAELNEAFGQEESGDNNSLLRSQEMNGAQLVAENVESNIAVDNTMAYYGSEEPLAALLAAEAVQRGHSGESKSGSDSGSSFTNVHPELKADFYVH